MKLFEMDWVSRINTMQIALVPVFITGFILLLYVDSGPKMTPNNIVKGVIEVTDGSLAQNQLIIPSIDRPDTLDQIITDCNKEKCISLTFDDGPNPATTPQILDELREAKVTASFFVLGMRIPGNEALLRRMQVEGHEIGNHSWNHPDFTKLTAEQSKLQIDQTQAAIVASGVPAPTLFRPPYGAINDAVVNEIRMNFVLWNSDPHDWSIDSPELLIQTVEASARPGVVLDLHDIYHVTTNALPKIISDLQSQGYHFVKVSQLLDIRPGAHGIYYGHP
jgi:peptidoglycan/xylan/chitin deacetylase (PgdA/CDA1 family)